MLELDQPVAEFVQVLVHHPHQGPAGLQRRAGEGPGCVDARLQKPAGSRSARCFQ
ncbi:MAG: hypothetical protein L6Q65_13775 [Zoogloea sp.]|nr:hypothetical protein [Zoogloea sp.]